MKCDGLFRNQYLRLYSQPEYDFEVTSNGDLGDEQNLSGDNFSYQLDNHDNGRASPKKLSGETFMVLPRSQSESRPRLGQQSERLVAGFVASRLKK
jgi:hypothetical protein